MFRILAAIACITMISAQEFRGTILGRIVDPSGAPTSGTKVEAVNADTGVLISSVTNDSGNYQIPFLVPGV